MACLREPAERALSSYLYMYKQGRLSCSFEEALGTVDELVEHGLYGKLLTPYAQHFTLTTAATPPLFQKEGCVDASYLPLYVRTDRVLSLSKERGLGGEVTSHQSPSTAPPLPQRERGLGACRFY
jgi:hypothetical protein